MESPHSERACTGCVVMSNQSWQLVTACLLIFSCHAPVRGALGPQDTPRAAMSRHVDELLAQRWAESGVQPAATSEDAEFMRRVYLDLAGTLPTAAQVRDFLNDESPAKRQRLIEMLLANPIHAAHLANNWRSFLLPGDVEMQQQVNIAGFEQWLRGKFLDNVRYDNVVADLLVATGAGDDVGPALFFTALELKPESLAANTSRIFLGVQIECAQCHDHPFDHWTQQDFWGYAAFFARVQQGQGRRRLGLRVVDARSGEITLPDTDQVVQPKYLNAGFAPQREDSRRRQLAIWLVSRDNPFFAKATVNRVWSQLFGRGIVEPVDDMSGRNPPSHPELLEELAAYFVQSGYDLREVYRVLANTEAYQLSSRVSEEADEAAPELFSRMAIKTLTADQLYDSLLKATRSRQSLGMVQPGLPVGADPQREAFRTMFRSPNPGGPEFEAGIPQALTLMNGTQVAVATDLQQGGMLTALTAPFLTDEECVEAMFLSTLSRFPRAAERDMFVDYVSRGGAGEDRQQALSDVFWALLNCAEFALNH